jgi:hypothetical protein
MINSHSQRYYILTEEEIEIIEDFMKNKHCKKCVYEGGGVKSGILSFLRSRLHIFEKSNLDEIDEIIRMFSESIDYMNVDMVERGMLKTTEEL